MTSSRDLALDRMAMTVLQPGFDGTAAPDWLRRALEGGLGGAVLFARNLIDPDQTAALVADLRRENPDVVVAVDEEGGAVTRLEAGTGSSWPGNYALGVADDVARTERVARQIGRLVAAADVTLDYAPVVDVNANPANPVIGIRSFGPDPELVARHAIAWIMGLQSAGVAACAKHFPGHGDTVVDSHLALPTVSATRELLDRRDLPPFRAAVAAGVRAIMCGHLLVPALDGVPATLSRAVLTGLLRDEFGFEGVVVTDAIEMRALAASHSPGEIAVRALAAGADAVCVGVSSPEGESVYALRDHIVAAVRDGSLPEERLAEAADRVLALAAWYAEQAPLRAAAAAQADDDGADDDGADDVRGGASLGEVAAWAALRVAPGYPVSTAGTNAPTGVAADGGTNTATSESAFSNAESSGGSEHDEVISDHAEVGDVALHDVASMRVDRPVVVGTPLVVDISARPTQAVGETTRTTLGRALAELLPGTRGVEVTAGGVLPHLREDGRPVVIVVHDAARHDWMRRLLADAVRDRPDAVVVETGLPGTPVGAVYLCTHGNSRASARAAARWLAGGGADGPAP